MAFKAAISSHSLGRAWHHDLPEKLDCAAAHGLSGVEIFYEDLEYLAKSLPEGLTQRNEIAAAQIIRHLCDARGISIICLQPFMHYEGLRDRKLHAARIQNMRHWFRLVKVLGTDTIQIPSSFLPKDQITDDKSIIISDMLEVAELGLKETPVVRFAHENLCWGTYCDRWEQVWEIVQAVDRPNFGMCLDTFNIAGRIYGDPAAPDGKTPDADAEVRASMDRLRKMVDPKKIFFIQVVDAEKMRSPLIEGHPFYVEGQPARMNWSRNARLFPFEEESYLPVLDVLKAIIDTGYTGWVSFELFSRTMSDPDPAVPEQHARRAEASWRKLCQEMGWDAESRGSRLPSTTRNGTAISKEPQQAVSSTGLISLAA